MRNFNENTITDAVLARLTDTSSPRLREVSAALVRHLHAFVREIRPTQDEWEQAIGFLTSTGQMCSDTRQEFILLSDVLGVSMLVDAINHPTPEGATETTVLGPFYVANPPEYELGANISPKQKGGAMFAEGTVRGTDGKPIRGAWIDTWHADDGGYYDVQTDASGATLDMRARLHTDADGRYWYHSIVRVLSGP